jgi:hypothetical protein
VILIYLFVARLNSQEELPTKNAHHQFSWRLSG